MAYIPRLDDTGMLNNIHWYSIQNPYYATGYGMPNCTAYAWGRFWEIGDPLSGGLNVPTHLPGYWDGQLWFQKAIDDGTYETGQVPALGAVICFTGGSAGHVAIVEEINSDGTIVTSNSAYGGPYFYTQTLSPSNNYSWTSAGGNLYTLQGFIYNPFGDNPPTPTFRRNKFPWVLYARKFRERNRH